jgi:hypothetical protein
MNLYLIEVWSEANRLMDKWELTDLRYQLDDAIAQAKKNLEKKAYEYLPISVGGR